MLAKMVKEGKGCYVRVERLTIVEVANPRVIQKSLNKDFDATLSGLVAIIHPSN